MPHTLGHKTVDTLWPGDDKFDTAWGVKTREGLAQCINELTAAPELLSACQEALVGLYAEHAENCEEPTCPYTNTYRKLIAAIAKAEPK